MKALLSRAPGGTNSLEIGDLALPVPSVGQVRIRVSACGINYPDLLVIEDKYQSRPERPFAPGLEVAGVIDAIGPGVEGIAVGERVMAYVDFGGLAEFVLAAGSRCVKLPNAMAFDQAAACTVTYGTSYHALKDRAQLKPGETLLVLGAAGGVGLAAVELGRAMGARVVAAVSSEEKALVAKTAGANATVVYPREIEDPRALVALFRESCPTGADVIYDPIGGDYAEPAIRALAWGGRYLVIGFAGGVPRPPLNLLLLKSSSVMGVFWGAASERDPAGQHQNLLEILALYERGLIQPLVSERYPLARGGEAIERLSRRQVVGKIIVTP